MFFLNCRLPWRTVALLIGSLITVYSDRTTAQIIPDATLGAETSRLMPAVPIRGMMGDRIDGAALRGVTLFHSFQEFNVNPAQRVYFQNPLGVETILSRVTGMDVSQSNDLDLQGQLWAGGNLTLRGQTATIRDTALQPFVAVANGTLTIQGDRTVDVFALNHAQSGLWAGVDLVLRSASPVIGDAHYWSGGSVRVEQLDSQLGTLLSPNDPIIRAGGDVRFDSYTGASLHIFAGESVVIPGTITITEADINNGLIETVTLSNGGRRTIDGQLQPTLNILYAAKNWTFLND